MQILQELLSSLESTVMEDPLRYGDQTKANHFFSWSCIRTWNKPQKLSFLGVAFSYTLQ